MNNYTSLLLDLDKDIHLWNGWMKFAMSWGGLDKAPCYDQIRDGAHFQDLIDAGVIVDYKFLPILDIFHLVSSMDKLPRLALLESITCDLSKVYDYVYDGGRNE